jgi:hypothetical protein
MVAAWFGLDALDRRGPLDDDELGLAAFRALKAALPGFAHSDVDPATGFIQGVGEGPTDMAGADNVNIMMLTPVGVSTSLGVGPSNPLLRSITLMDARVALPAGREDAAHGEDRAVELWTGCGGVGGFTGTLAWAKHAAPLRCETFKAAVARYAAVVGRYGRHGARAARAWARLEGFLSRHAPAVHNGLLPGWRGPPPQPEINVHPSVAASLALHAGQVTTGGVVKHSWTDARPEEAMAASFGGLCGAVSTYGGLHSGFLNSVYMNPHDSFFYPTTTTGGAMPCVALEAEDRPGGGLTVRRTELDGDTLRALVVPMTLFPRRVYARAPELLNRTLMLDVATGAVWGMGAAAPPGSIEHRRTRRTLSGRPLVRADGGRGFLGWLEELAARFEAGLYGASSPVLQADPSEWERVRCSAGRDDPLTLCLSGFPTLPLDDGARTPADLAAIAANHADAGVGIALTAGAFQVVASTVYLVADTLDFGGRESLSLHVWTYVEALLLGPSSSLTPPSPRPHCLPHTTAIITTTKTTTTQVPRHHSAAEM